LYVLVVFYRISVFTKMWYMPNSLQVFDPKQNLQEHSLWESVEFTESTAKHY